MELHTSSFVLGYCIGGLILLIFNISNDIARVLRRRRK